MPTNLQDEIYDAYAHIPIDDVPDEVNNALRLIADNLARQANSPVVPKFHEPPVRVYDGLMVFADGVNWDPGFGRGVYVWDGSIDIQGVISDGQLVGTIPAWAPAGDYNIICNFFSASASPAQAQAIISSLAAANNRSVFGQNSDNTFFGQHQSGSAGGTGTVSGSLPLSDELLSQIVLRVNSGIANIETVINGVTDASVFNHQGAPSFTTIFNDTTFGIADGIFISRLVLQDVSGADDRVYLLDDGITGNIVDTSGNGQDGTWNNILSGNVITQQGAWVPLSNAA